MPEQIPTSLIVTHGAIAMFGAITHALSAHRNGEAKTWADMFTLTVMSSFSGVMFSLVGLHLFAGDHYITLAMAGTGGFLGVEGMAWITAFVKSKLSK